MARFWGPCPRVCLEPLNFKIHPCSRQENAWWPPFWTFPAYCFEDVTKQHFLRKVDLGPSSDWHWALTFPNCRRSFESCRTHLLVKWQLSLILEIQFSLVSLCVAVCTVLGTTTSDLRNLTPLSCAADNAVFSWRMPRWWRVNGSTAREPPACTRSLAPSARLDRLQYRFFTSSICNLGDCESKHARAKLAKSCQLFGLVRRSTERKQLVFTANDVNSFGLPQLVFSFGLGVDAEVHSRASGSPDPLRGRDGIRRLCWWRRCARLFCVFVGAWQQSTRLLCKDLRKLWMRSTCSASQAGRRQKRRCALFENMKKKTTANFWCWVKPVKCSF